MRGAIYELERPSQLDLGRLAEVTRWGGPDGPPHLCPPQTPDQRLPLSRPGFHGGFDEVELVHHSDAGSQYTSYDYSQTLDDHQLLASIGSVGDAYDNALAESFVDSFKTELIRDRVWRTRSQLELAIVEYVAWFNSERLHSALGDVPPAEYEEVESRR